MNTQSHSPLPWRSQEITPGTVDIVDANGHYVAISASQENARLIIDSVGKVAVSPHSALVSALEGLLANLDGIPGSGASDLQQVVNEASAVLAQVKGGK